MDTTDKETNERTDGRSSLRWSLTLMTNWRQQNFDRLVESTKGRYCYVYLLKNNFTELAWAKCIVAHPTEVLGGPLPIRPTLQRLPYDTNTRYRAIGLH